MKITKTKSIGWLAIIFLSLPGMNLTVGKTPYGRPNPVAPTRAATLKLITGGFIQYQGWMIKSQRNPTGLDERAWEDEIEAMRSAKMDTVVIQRLEADGASFIPVPGDRGAVDPTEIILRYADAHSMNVFLGL